MGANTELMTNIVPEEKHVSVRDFVSKIEEVTQLEPVTGSSNLPESMNTERVSVRDLVRRIEEIK